MNVGLKRFISQMGMFLLFFIVPILDWFRLDLSQNRFYLFQRSFPFSEGYIFLLSVLLLIFLFIGISKWFGRQFCGWMCPHNTFSVNISKFIRSNMFVNHKILGRSVDFLLSLIFAPVIAFSMLAYFYSPVALFAEILSFRYASWSFNAYLLLCVSFFVMIKRLRSNFCRHACPYGMFQMLLADKNSKMGNVKNMFRGAGLFFLLIVIGVSGLLFYSVIHTKGFSVSVQKQLQGVKAGEQVLYSYSVNLANDSNQNQEYHIQLEGIPSHWKADYPKEIKVKANDTVTESILFHIDRESLNQNYSILMHIQSDHGNQLDRKLTIFPTVR